MEIEAYEQWKSGDPDGMVNVLKYLLMKHRIALCHLHTPATHPPDNAAMQRYQDISESMGIPRPPHLVVVDNEALRGSFTEVSAIYMRKRHAIVIKRQYWENFTKGTPDGEYVIRHELGHAADQSHGIDRRTFLGGILAGAIQPAATVGGIAAAVGVSKTMRSPDTLPDPLRTTGEAAAGGTLGHKAASPLKTWAVFRNESRKVRIKEMTADQHALSGMETITMVRGILDTSGETIGTLKEKIQGLPFAQLRAKVRDEAAIVRIDHPDIPYNDAESIALLKLDYTRPDLIARLSSNPHKNGDYPHPYERIMALLGSTHTPPTQGHSR